MKCAWCDGDAVYILTYDKEQVIISKEGKVTRFIAQKPRYACETHKEEKW